MNFSRQIQKALMAYKSSNGLVPEYISSKFVKHDGTLHPQCDDFQTYLKRLQTNRENREKN